MRVAHHPSRLRARASQHLAVGNTITEAVALFASVPTRAANETLVPRVLEQLGADGGNPDFEVRSEALHWLSDLTRG